MAERIPDPARDPEDGDEIATGTPRWVKVFGVVALGVVVLVVVVLLVRGGEHGPGRHSSGGAAGAVAGDRGPPPGLTSGHTQR